MAEIKPSEKLMFEKILGLNSGYVLEFSNSTFHEFIFNLVRINIYDDRYLLYGDSKAKRLRAFWQLESDKNVGLVLKELLECWRTNQSLKNITVENNEQQIYEQCLNVTNRLLGITSPKNKEHVSSKDEFLNKEFENVSIEKLHLDSGVVQILNSRLNEINNNLKAGAALSVIIMCGGVLEGIFLGVATSKMKDFNISKASPKNKDTGKVLPFYEWSLNNFIDVAHDIDLIGLDVKKYSHSLRDFRNYIHPYEQMSSKFDPDIETAKISWQVLKAAISDLEKRINK
jgi:hypothetical protein